MHANHLVASRRAMIVAANLYAIGVVAVLAFALPRQFLVPAVLIALGVPFVFRLVPRNWLYGLRTPRTLYGGDATWYRHNALAGMVGTAIGVVWLIVVVTR